MKEHIHYVVYIPLIVYIVFLFYLLLRARKRKSTPSVSFTPDIAILIAMRNEEQFIGRLIDSLLIQNYPAESFNIYIVDDHSTDRSVEIVKSYEDSRINLIQLPPGMSTKKKAIQYALTLVTEEYILSTDADCIVGKLWVSTMTKNLAHQDGNRKLITAPVHIISEVQTERGIKKQNLFARMQYLELAAMMLITEKGINSQLFYLANGANMAFLKSAYLSVTQDMRFDVASGDDTFLIQAIEKKWKDSTHFVDHLDAIVSTDHVPSLKDFIQQRLRWAGKSISMESNTIYIFQAVTWCAMLGFIISFGMSLFYGVHIFLIYFLILSLIDIIILWNYRRLYIPNIIDIIAIPFTVVFHAIYVFFIGLISNFSRSYEWKGRRLS